MEDMAEDRKQWRQLTSNPRSGKLETIKSLIPFSSTSANWEAIVLETLTFANQHPISAK